MAKITIDDLAKTPASESFFNELNSCDVIAVNGGFAIFRKNKKIFQIGGDKLRISWWG